MTPGLSLAFDEDFGLAGGFECDITASSKIADAPALAPGRYFLLASCDCWILRGDETQTALKSSTGSSFLLANTYMPFQVTPSDTGPGTTAQRDRIAVVAAGGTEPGVLRILPVSRKVPR